MIEIQEYSGLGIQENHLIEDIDSYLEPYKQDWIIQRKLNIKEFFDNPDTFSFKVEINETSARVSECSYMSMYDEESDDLRYYFITNWEYISPKIWRCTVKLDVVNTYQSDIMNTYFLKEVTIKRRHKDRWFHDSINKRYNRLFDKVDEGLGEVANTMESVKKVNYDDCYLVTRQLPTLGYDNGTGPSVANYSSKLITSAYANYSETLNVTKYSYDIPLKLVNDAYLIIPNSTEGILNINVTSTSSTGASRRLTCDAVYWKENTGGTHQVYPLQKQDDDSYILKELIQYSKIDATYTMSIEGTHPFKIYDATWVQIMPAVGTLFSLNKWSPDFKANCNTSTVIKRIKAKDEMNVSDNNLKSIINVPIESINESNLVSWGDYLVIPNGKLLSETNNVTLTSNYVLDANWKGHQVVDRNKYLESKLYGSYVRDHYLAYDSFKLPIQPEYLTDISKLTLTTYVPCDMTNNVMIKATNVKESGYNDNVLACTRNNNMTVYSDDYLDYVRNGYNYDQKQKTMASISNWIGFATSAVGTGASIATGLGGKKNAISSLIGLNVIQSGVSAVSSFTNAIMQDMQNEEALKNKRTQLLNSSVNMSGSDNVLLFKELCGGVNAIEYVTQAPRTEVLESIYNLFYYAGYADGLFYESMPTIKTREYFNYVQADIGRCNIGDLVLRQRVIDAYAQGITFEWHYNDTWLSKGTLYENWETSI